VARATLQVVESAAPRQAETLSEPNYKDFDRPPAMRRARSGASGQAPASTAEAGGEDYFDIPAFLRRQAD
jgi:cell division protein FtsZ